MLLQHWSWAHLIVGRPTITCKTDVPDWGRPEPDTCPAYAHMWSYSKTYVGAGHGGTLGINHWRQEIEHLRDDPEYVTWQPYREYVSSYFILNLI
jgi:hypothetical protein